MIKQTGRTMDDTASRSLSLSLSLVQAKCRKDKEERRGEREKRKGEEKEQTNAPRTQGERHGHLVNLINNNSSKATDDDNNNNGLHLTFSLILKEVEGGREGANGEKTKLFLPFHSSSRHQPAKV